jgi:transcriptional regulator with XRE-family HTH domain
MLVMAAKDDWQSRVRVALECSKLSMRALSEKAGFSPTYVSALLRGEIDKRGPSANSLRRIAAAAEVDQDWIVTGKGQARAAGSARKAKSAAGAKLQSGELARSNDEPYIERHRALLLLRPHLEGDGERVRDYLLTLAGTPYDAWEASDWLAEAERIHERVRAVDAAWARQSPPRKAGGRRAKPGKQG